ELANNTVLPNINDEHVTADFVSDDIIIAHFKTTLSVDIGNDTTICEGDSILLDAGHSGAIFHWQDGSTDSTLWVSQAGTYSVTVTEGFSTGYASITVDVMHGYAGPDHSICYGNSVVLSASGGDFYQWSPPTGLSATNVANPMANPTVTTTYTVTITTAYGCSDIDDVVVSVSPPINLSVIANTYKVCPNEPVVLTPIASDGYGPPYYIFDSAGMVVTPPIYVYPQETTTYEFSVEDVCGSHASASVTIETHPLPVIVISSDTTEGCQPLEVHFQEFGGLDNKSWVWDFGNGDYSMTQNPVYTYNEPGVFDVSITVSNIYNCKASYTEPQMITVHPTPVAKFTADPENVSIIKPQIFFTNMSTGGSIILWSFGDDEESSLISPMHTYPVYPTGTYNVQLVVISDYGCSDTASKEVTVYDEFTFWAPNAFTPDYDGINEQFMIKGNGIDPRNFNMKIYDRWGELIFETDDINEGWDGRVNGIMSTFFPCVYTWLVTYRDLKGVLHEKAGAVTLLK
ncbi:MAG: PKD domain-containing protein, partial [Bacteroidota bacterium]